MEKLKRNSSLLILIFLIANLNAQSRNLFITGETIHFDKPVIISHNNKLGNIIIESEEISNHFNKMLNSNNSYLFIPDIYFLNDLTEYDLRKLNNNYKSCNQYDLEYHRGFEVGTFKENVKEFIIGFIEANYYNENIVTADNSKTIIKASNGKTYYKFIIANCSMSKNVIIKENHEKYNTTAIPKDENHPPSHELEHKKKLE